MVYTNQDYDKYIINNISSNIVHDETISNSFTQVLASTIKSSKAQGNKQTAQITKSKRKKQETDIDELLGETKISDCTEQVDEKSYIGYFASFDGRIIKYDLLKKTFLNEKNINNFISKEMYESYLTNPPYVSAISYNPELNLVGVGLMNGVIISFKGGSMKKESITTIHEQAVSKIVNSSFESKWDVSLGKDNKLKIIEGFHEVKHEIDIGRAYGSLKCVPVDFICTNSRKILIADTLNDSIKMFELK